jgi:CDP-diacylglycerol--glycerol-3-phosphate 3-phosphatidyltransferase/cardiolipin synthase
MPVSNMAKIKTFFQMVAISVLLTGPSGDKLLFNFGSEIGIVLLWISAILTLITGYSYVKKGIDHAID